MPIWQLPVSNTWKDSASSKSLASSGSMVKVSTSRISRRRIISSLEMNVGRCFNSSSTCSLNSVGRVYFSSAGRSSTCFFGALFLSLRVCLRSLRSRLAIRSFVLIYNLVQKLCKRGVVEDKECWKLSKWQTVVVVFP